VAPLEVDPEFVFNLEVVATQLKENLNINLKFG
jgi:hypothetical protein